eukprot:c23126_g1_i1 orf=400-1101(-)
MATTDAVPTSDAVSTDIDSYDTGDIGAVDAAQSKVKQVTGLVLGSANKAADTSKALFSKVAKRVDKYADLAHQKAGDFQSIGKSLLKTDAGNKDSITASDCASSDPTETTSRDAAVATESQDGSVAFPLSIFTWCATLCGGSKSSNEQVPRELPTSFLKGATDRFSTTVTDASGKLEKASARLEKAADAAVHQAAGYVQKGSSKIQAKYGQYTAQPTADSGATSDAAAATAAE